MIRRLTAASCCRLSRTQPEIFRELQTSIEKYLASLARENASPHTLRNYAADLEQFAVYFSPAGIAPPAPRDIGVLALREWLGDLYDRGLSVITIRRKLAAVRALYRFMLREGTILSNPARLHRPAKRHSSPGRLTLRLSAAINSPHGFPVFTGNVRSHVIRKRVPAGIHGVRESVPSGKGGGL